MYHKIVNPETRRLVDINGRIGRKVLARYVSISKIGNTLNLEQTGGSYKEGDIMILYGGGLNGPTLQSNTALNLCQLYRCLSSRNIRSELRVHAISSGSTGGV